MTETATGHAELVAQKTIRHKALCGVTLTWCLGKTREGKFKALSCGNPRPVMPLDFLPFEIAAAVYNRNNSFDTMEEAEAFVRSL